jgi:hypothetical protein
MIHPTDSDWLRKAQGLAVGCTQRVRHGSESRSNLVIGNTNDRWYCYCHACHEGGVVLKEHVVLDVAPPKSADVTLPDDLIDMPIEALRFLHSKNMDMTYFDGVPVKYSPSRKRIIIGTPAKAMGRDITGKSPMKWITYNRQTYLGNVQPNTVFVEDTFSYYKVKWALSDTTMGVVCTLGTSISQPLLLEILKRSKRVVFFYDGDAAGLRGARAEAQRVRQLGIEAAGNLFNAPTGLDPKDMAVLAIRNHLDLVIRGY